jgi:hypothetical protein
MNEKATPEERKPDEQPPLPEASEPIPPVILPPGQGAPVQPGPPASVNAPIEARTFNIGALLFVVGIVILVLVLLGAIVVIARLL